MTAQDAAQVSCGRAQVRAAKPARPAPGSGRPREALLAALAILLSVAAGKAEALESMGGESAERWVEVGEDLLAVAAEGQVSLMVLASRSDTSLGIALRWAGNKSAAPLIRAANAGAEPEPGKFYAIPASVLLDEHRLKALAALFPDELPDAPLEYASDGEGGFAVYRLKRGEAIYSAVVVRFTGRLEVEEVSALARRVAERSGIRDVRDIPVGYAVKIPVDLLLPEFQPPGSPARAEREAAVIAAAGHGLSAPAKHLSGVHVILDAGHGGKDPGAIRKGVYEDEHAYDVMCRVARLLKSETEAEVYTTVYDVSSRYSQLDGTIRQDTDEILVEGRVDRGEAGLLALDGSESFNLRGRGATREGVNDRFRIANERYARLRRAGVEAEKVVFISLHADALHESVRGAMIYVPGREKSQFLPAGISRGDREEAVGLSRGLARGLLAGLREEGILVHPEPAIRDRIYRRGYNPYIPAVVRETVVPPALLVEVAHLNTTEDRRQLVRSEFRERFAAAIVAALVEYYGSARDGPDTRLARLD